MTRTEAISLVAAALIGASAPLASPAAYAAQPEAGPAKWFAKDPAFDVAFRDRFALLYGRASRGELAGWRATPEGALAEILLLDQYPRNAFRGTPWMYATDALAREAADAAVRAGHDKSIPVDLRVFVYLPFGHSENLADQQRSVELSAAMPEPSPRNARRHHDIILRFGRFPHRNPILGRTMTGEEQDYLDDGGFKG
jgi:uncharacterized protein (DUF924 family)